MEKEQISNLEVRLDKWIQQNAQSAKVQINLWVSLVVDNATHNKHIKVKTKAMYNEINYLKIIIALCLLVPKDMGKKFWRERNATLAEMWAYLHSVGTQHRNRVTDFIFHGPMQEPAWAAPDVRKN